MPVDPENPNVSPEMPEPMDPEIPLAIPEVPKPDIPAEEPDSDPLKKGNLPV
ncbi:MAG: hypothetical protein R8G34_13460 [Paracoccaceae bacterium]|nr:hypothetical protein [Paracoccaceae bacterium]